MVQSGGRFPCVISFFLFRGILCQISVILIRYRRMGSRDRLRWDNLHVGVLSRHRLDSLNTSNDLLLLF